MKLRQYLGSLSPLQALLACLALAYGNGLFNHSLIPSMEPRFAEVVTEMLASGHYLIPVKNGVPYVEYPPLLYWLGVLGAKLGLPTEAAIRLPCYLAFLFWIVLLDRLQGLLWKSWPRGVMALLGAALPAVLWHFFTAQSDSILILGVLLAFVGFVEARLGQGRGGFPWKLWVGIALATAAKGPVGIACTLPPMFLELLISAMTATRAETDSANLVVRLFRAAAPLKWLRGLLLLVATNLPWYVMAGLDRGWDFVRAVVVYQNFHRYLTGYDHLQPWWYYFQSALTGLFPISLLVPLGVWVSLRRLRSLPERLVLTWAIFTFLFFTVSASKQGKYLLPAAPAFVALGLLGAGSVRRISADRVMLWLKRWAAGLVALWALAVVLVLPFYSNRIADVRDYALIRQAIEERPGKLVSYRWPRALQLYELGAPMDYVNSARQLYAEIRGGRMAPGDYLMVSGIYRPGPAGHSSATTLSPWPGPPYFEPVLSLKTEKNLQLFRLLPGAGSLAVPATPEPERPDWRSAEFDTD